MLKDIEGENRSAKVTHIKLGAKPTLERQLQNGGVTSEIIPWDGHGKALIKRYRAAWECPLDAYAAHGAITDPEYEVGLRFRCAYFRAVLSRSARRERINNYPDTEDLTLSERLLKAAYRVLPPENRIAVIDICGNDYPAQDYRRLASLKKGLGHLVMQWHLAAAEVCDPKPKAIKGQKSGVYGGRLM